MPPATTILPPVARPEQLLGLLTCPRRAPAEQPQVLGARGCHLSPVTVGTVTRWGSARPCGPRIGGERQATPGPSSRSSRSGENVGPGLGDPRRFAGRAVRSHREIAAPGRSSMPCPRRALVERLIDADEARGSGCGVGRAGHMPVRAHTLCSDGADVEYVGTDRASCQVVPASVAHPQR